MRCPHPHVRPGIQGAIRCILRLPLHFTVIAPFLLLPSAGPALTDCLAGHAYVQHNNDEDLAVQALFGTASLADTLKGTNMSQTLNPNPNPNLVRAYRQGSGDLIRRAFPERNLARTRACAAHTRRNGKIGAPLARGHT